MVNESENSVVKPRDIIESNFFKANLVCIFYYSKKSLIQTHWDHGRGVGISEMFG